MMSQIFVSQAVAWDIIAEPYIGLSQFVFTNEGNGSNDRDDDFASTGFHLGMRLGFLFGRNFSLSAEYFQGGPYSDLDSAGEKTTVRQYGAVAAYDFDGVKISVAYFPIGILDEDDGGDEEGEAYRVGVALPIKSSNLWANLDYTIFPIFDTSDDEKGTNAMVSLSFPVDF